jgi:hypothetical protein
VLYADDVALELKPGRITPTRLSMDELTIGFNEEFFGNTFRSAAQLTGEWSSALQGGLDEAGGRGDVGRKLHGRRCRSSRCRPRHPAAQFRRQGTHAVGIAASSHPTPQGEVLQSIRSIPSDEMVISNYVFIGGAKASLSSIRELQR